ncbi:SAF domain-containing protein [Paenibacillus alvei]|uniref:SAF domain-containing protein n=1 Tax=Paenibacillus alvei TaxID=44250 RepID=UPI0022802AE8|nr:SAF domain-containing protein [Paenibacillus alvei]
MRRWTRKTKQMIAASVGGAAAAGLLVGGYHYWAIGQNDAVQRKAAALYEDEIAKLRKLADAELQKRTSVWVFNQPLLAGKRIRSDDIAKIEMSSDLAPKQALNHPDQIIGKVLKIDTVPRTPVISTMLYEDGKMSDDLRWVETAVIQLPLRLQEKDMIDVRIRFPNGQDYIILSKKEIKSMQYPTIWAHMDEQERLLFSSACVDAFVNGGQIYALRYIEPQIQNEAVPNYPANEQVLKLIEADPSIVKKADTALTRLVRSRMEKEWERQSANKSLADGWNNMEGNRTDASYVSTHGEGSAEVSGYSPLTGRAGAPIRNSPFVGQPGSNSVQSTDLSSNENQRETGVVQQDNDTRKQPNPKNGEQGIAKKGSTINHDAENHQDKILNRGNLNKESTGEVSTGEEVSSIFSEAIPSSKKQ